MECKLQNTTVPKWCVTVPINITLTFAVQVLSLSYHAASGNIAVGLDDGKVEMWQTALRIAPAPQAALPVHVCVRQRLTVAQTQADAIQTVLSKADDGLRMRVSREQELKRSIADLETKRTHITVLLKEKQDVY